jgi:glyoxylase-like metal-dependent hydrolase (beta-lactamase superfamily II)/8-oxo-dGTP pyrophosphatase MutT (NUDIX family)
MSAVGLAESASTRKGDEMSGGPPAAVRPAATVVLHRRGTDGLEVFWVRRGEQLRFAGGFYAFPGGRVDVADAALPLAHAEAVGDTERACLAAAARELFEETGVLLASNASRVPAEARRAAREALLRRDVAQEKEGAFAEFLAAHGVVVDAKAFTPAGRWVTPPALPVRFDARFYLAELPAGETAEVWPGELVDGEWVRPEEALRRWEQGSALLHPPAWHTLSALALGLPAALPLLQDTSRAPWKLPVHDWVVERIEFQRGVIMVPLRTPTLPPATHTNCLLLGDEELWVVDPGSPYPEEQATLDKTLSLLHDEGRRAAGVLLTHHHHDHVGGATHLARKLDLPIAATAQTAELLDFPVQRILREGDALQVGPRGWKCLHLPGHTRGHLCLIEEGSGAVVAGDLVAGIGTVIVDPPEGDMLDYLASLRRLLQLGPGVIYPAHGPVVSAGADRLRGYLEHRLQREELVLAALRSLGAATPAQLVPPSYPDVQPEVYPLAERSLLAHLGKLVKEGRARLDERGRYAAVS